MVNLIIDRNYCRVGQNKKKHLKKKNHKWSDYIKSKMKNEKKRKSKRHTKYYHLTYTKKK